MRRSIGSFSTVIRIGSYVSSVPEFAWDHSVYQYLHTRRIIWKGQGKGTFWTSLTLRSALPPRPRYHNSSTLCPEP
eukprot:2007500-Rhodomonas_salina.1